MNPRVYRGGVCFMKNDKNNEAKLTYTLPKCDEVKLTQKLHFSELTKKAKNINVKYHINKIRVKNKT